MADFPDSTTTPEITRSMLEAEIERMISALDLFDPDPDLEDNGDAEPDEDGEPILGWTDMQARFNRAYGPYTDVDADGCELDEADSEPELGSLEGVNQLHWSKGRDAEPSLGSMDNCINQSAWGRFASKDYEMDCEDEGADFDRQGQSGATSNYLGYCGPISVGKGGGT